VLSPIDRIHSVSPRLTPFLLFPMFQSTLIHPDYARLYLRVHFLLVHGQKPEPLSECTPSASGTQQPSEIRWPSHDDCATMHHWHHLIGWSLSQWTWDLRVPNLFIFNLFSSHCMLILPLLLHSGPMHTCDHF